MQCDIRLQKTKKSKDKRGRGGRAPLGPPLNPPLSIRSTQNTSVFNVLNF